MKVLAGDSNQTRLEAVHHIVLHVQKCEGSYGEKMHGEFNAIAPRVNMCEAGTGRT